MDNAAADSGYATRLPTYIHILSLGVFSHKKGAGVWWKCWSLYNTIAAVPVCVSGVLYLVTEDVTRLEDLVATILGIFSPILVIALQRECYKFTDNWDKLKKILDADFVTSLDADGDLRQVEKVKNLKPWIEYVRWLAPTYLGFPFMIAFINFLWLSLRGDTDFCDVSSYWYPFPGIRTINTREIYLWINFWQSLSVPGLGVACAAMWLLLSIIVVELTNKSVVLEERMKLLADQVYRTVDAIRENEMKIDAIKIPRQRELAARRARNDKEICFQKFNEDLKICVQHHQVLLQAFKYLRPSLNGCFTFSLGLLTLVMVGSAFFITLVKGFEFDSHIMVKYFTLLLCMMLQTGFQCVLAQHFQNKNDKIAELVYELPWYELSPKYRKNVYIFLCQAQAPVKFYAFKTFRFSTYLFPTILKFVYNSTVNLLTIQQKRHRN